MLVSITDKLKFIENSFGSARLARNSKNAEVRCPICAPSDRTKKKLAIRIEDDACHCWTCGFKARTLLPLLKRHGSRSAVDEYVTKFMPHLAARARNMVDEFVDEVKLPADFRMLAVASRKLPDVRAALNYWTSRKLSEADLWYHKVGISNEVRWAHRIIVPSFDADGKLNYFVARAIDKKRRPKYDNPDHDKRHIIFNEINIDWKKPVVLCEGVFDAFKCGDNVIPLLGSDLNEETAVFNALLTHSSTVAVALDADMMSTKVLKMLRKLQSYDIDAKFVNVSEYGDPGEMTKEQFKIALSEAKSLSWQDSFMMKVSGSLSTTRIF